MDSSPDPRSSAHWRGSGRERRCWGSASCCWCYRRSRPPRPRRTGAGITTGGGVTISKAPYGTLADGTAIDQYTLANHSGMTVKIITYGGIVTEIDTPDRHGKTADVALGFDNLADYVAKSPYFGAIIGRYANRIAKGMFTLDGTTYTLADQQRRQRPARRAQGLRQAGLEGERRAARERQRRPQAQLHERQRRRGLSRAR